MLLFNLGNLLYIRLDILIISVISNTYSYLALVYLKSAYGEQLVSSFREEGMKKFGFSHYRKFNGAPLEVLGRSGSEPTFWEFVQGIVREGK